MQPQTASVSTTVLAALPTRSIPTTVLVGFLGAGKTTLLNAILDRESTARIAVIVNDCSQINVGAQLNRHATEQVIELSVGCICCTSREDLVTALRQLLDIPGIERIVVEATGIGEPLQIAQAFDIEDLPARVHLDEIITVVDAAHFWSTFERDDLIEDADGNPVMALREQPHAPLLVAQLEYTNIVLLNKIDIADPAHVDRLEGFVHSLNPDAHILRTRMDTFDPHAIIGTGRYSSDHAVDAPGWDESWDQDDGDAADDDDFALAGESDEYGFNTFTWATDAPLDRERFIALLADWPEEILRAKGFATLERGSSIVLSAVRQIIEVQEIVSPEDLDDDEHFDEGESEIVFIGRDMPVSDIIARLDACQAAN